MSTRLRDHLNGVKPLGVTLQTGACNIRDKSLGRFSLLSDELLLIVLEVLSAKDLIRLSSVSKALYCFSNHEDLWKALVIEVCNSDLLGYGDVACRMLWQWPPRSCWTFARAK